MIARDCGYRHVRRFTVQATVQHRIKEHAQAHLIALVPLIRCATRLKTATDEINRTKL